MTGKERAFFRARANTLEPVFQIGKGGVSDALVKQADDALKKRELIKIKALLDLIHETPRELADKLSAATGAEIIQVIGGSIVLYKENKELRKAEKEKEKRKKEASKRLKLKARVSDGKKHKQGQSAVRCAESQAPRRSSPHSKPERSAGRSGRSSAAGERGGGKRQNKR